MALTVDDKGRTFVQHRNGQVSHYILDDFTDPWKPSEVVLLQHGFCRTAAHWYHWIPPLAGRIRVIRRDLRGHGMSSFPPKHDTTYSYTLETILEEIIDLLDLLRIDKVHFLGESTSGMLGEALAARHPDRLHSLTICSSPTHLPPPTLAFFSFGHVDWPTACREMGSRGWGEALSRSPGTVASPDKRYIAWWLDQVAASDGEGLAGYADFLSKLDGRPFLGDIRVPMLILAPKNSAVMTVEQMRELAGRVPGPTTLEVIDAPGHEIFVTGAEQCQAAALRFWSSLTGSGQGTT